MKKFSNPGRTKTTVALLNLDAGNVGQKYKFTDEMDYRSCLLILKLK